MDMPSNLDEQFEQLKDIDPESFSLPEQPPLPEPVDHSFLLPSDLPENKETPFSLPSDLPENKNTGFPEVGDPREAFRQVDREVGEMRNKEFDSEGLLEAILELPVRIAEALRNG